MRQTFIALAAAVTLAAALPSSAQAHCRGCGVAAGVVGGLAAGAIIGSAIANSGPVYAGPPPRPRRRSITTTTMRRSATSNAAASGWKATAGATAASKCATSA